MNGYNLTRKWFDFKFENPSKVRAVHTDFYIYLVDQWNRLGQKKEFGLPTSYTMECLGIGSYNTYKKTLSDLVTFGFVKVIKDSKNQHISKIIAISKYDKATDKPNNEALDKATIKAIDKAIDKASDNPIDTINEQYKQYNNLTIEQINNLLIYFNQLEIGKVDKFISERQKEKSSAKKEKEIEILSFLNETAGKSFKPVESNLKFIRARLSEHPPETLKQIIQVKSFEWKDDFKMNEYLRPETLFNPTKFQTYLQKVEEIKNNPQKFKKDVQQRNNENRRSAAKHYDPLDAMPD